MSFSRAVTTALVLAACLASESARCDEDLFGLSETAPPEELFWEVLLLQAEGVLSEETFAEVQRGLDTVEKYYATDRDHDDQARRILVAALRRTRRAEPGDENAHLHDAQEGRAYARRLHAAGVRAAEEYAQRTIFIAGMLGVPTSKGELALILALPAAGYLVGKVAALTYKKAALLLRKLRTPDEVLSCAGALGIRVERVESKAGLEGLIGRDAVASVDSAPGALAGPTTAGGGGARFIAGTGGEILDVTRIRIPGPRNSPFGKVDYLLGNVSSVESVGKGGFFRGALGFSEGNLGPALERHLIDNFGTATIEGSRIRAVGALVGPGGRSATVQSVWQVTSEGYVDLITAVPR